jgi:hypothetical protein
MSIGLFAPFHFRPHFTVSGYLWLGEALSLQDRQEEDY